MLNSDVIQIILRFVEPENFFEAYYANLTMLDRRFWIKKLSYDTGASHEEIGEIWDTGEIGDYRNYVRVLAYYDIPVRGISHFLNKRLCKHLFNKQDIRENLFCLSFFVDPPNKLSKCLIEPLVLGNIAVLDSFGSQYTSRKAFESFVYHNIFLLFSEYKVKLDAKTMKWIGDNISMSLLEASFSHARMGSAIFARIFISKCSNPKIVTFLLFSTYPLLLHYYLKRVPKEEILDLLNIIKNVPGPLKLANPENFRLLKNYVSNLEYPRKLEDLAFIERSQRLALDI